MLTIDDINSINEKYGKIGFWHQIDCSKIDLSIIPPYGTYDVFTYCDGIKIGLSKGEDSSTMYAKVFNTPISSNMLYLSDNNGIVSNVNVTTFSNFINIGMLSRQRFKEIYINLFVVGNPVNLTSVDMKRYLFIPMSSLNIPVVNGDFPEKLYISPLPTSINPQYAIDGEVTTLGEDEKGKYFILPSAEDCVIGRRLDDFNVPLYNVNFKEFKTLPILSIPTIYKGNTQTIQLMNDTEEITEFQAYYKGELLNDNKITLPYDADDYIDITVDLLDNRYPNSTLKLKAPTQMYIASTLSEVETAIANGITTLQVGDTGTEVSLNGIDLTNVQLVNSNIQLTNSTLTNCTILNSQYTDNGANNINNTNFNECEITTTSISTYTDCTITECTILNSELHITGTLQDNTFNNSLIVSDGEITLTNNTFTGIGSKTYFPSHLYLTGDYTLQNNTFTMTGTFTELQFNMCLIKATNDFNVSKFINKNTFQLNITYESEPTSTLYYNIVDDDKIRARRL